MWGTARSMARYPRRAAPGSSSSGSPVHQDGLVRERGYHSEGIGVCHVVVRLAGGGVSGPVRIGPGSRSGRKPHGTNSPAPQPFSPRTMVKVSPSSSQLINGRMSASQVRQDPRGSRLACPQAGPAPPRDPEHVTQFVGHDRLPLGSWHREPSIARVRRDRAVPSVRRAAWCFRGAAAQELRAATSVDLRHAGRAELTAKEHPEDDRIKL